MLTIGNWKINSKTVMFNILLIFVGIISYAHDNIEQLQPLVPAEYWPKLVFASGIVGVFLRLYRTSGVLAIVNTKRDELHDADPDDLLDDNHSA